MLNINFLTFLPFLVSLVIAYASAPLVIKFAKKFDLIDDPKKDKHKKKIHTYPVPRSGGLIIFISVFISALIFLPFDKHLIGILAGVLVLAVLGVADDKYDLNPYFRLLVQFIAAGMPIIAGIGISFLTSPINGVIDLSNPRITFELFGDIKSIWILSDLFALFWIVALMNFINMGAKGVDGQLPGVAVVASVTIALLSLRFSADITQWSVIILASITAGAFLGFLPWNAYPQKIMPGFSGSNLAGYLLGVLSILSTTKVGTLLVVLGIPLIDTGYTLIRRILSGKSPVWGDKGHLHHKLLEAGYSKRKVAYLYWVSTAILGFAALQLNTSSKIYTIIGVTIFVGGLLLWLTWQKKY